MTVLRSGGRIPVMRLLRTKLKILIPVLLVIRQSLLPCSHGSKHLVIEELGNRKCLPGDSGKTGDELSFQ